MGGNHSTTLTVLDLYPCVVNSYVATGIDSAMKGAKIAD